VILRKLELTKEEKRIQVWTLKQAGFSNKIITERTGFPRRSIQKICKTVRETNSFKDRPRKGRPPKMTEREKRKAVLLLKQKKATTATAIQKELAANYDVSVCSKTVSRVLKEFGFVARIKKKKPKLTTAHKKARLAWAKKYENWSVEEWKKVVWSDESKFNVIQSDGKEYFWTQHPSVITEDSITPTMKFGGGGVNVWSCITWEGTGFSCKINETLDAELYCRILREELMKTFEYYGIDKEEAIFQHDNDPKHTSKLANDALSDLDLKVMTWPSQSPDLNPIEHYWDHVGRQLKQKQVIVRTKDQLWIELEKILIEKNKELCRKLISTMPRRVLDLIKAKGGHTKW
jgi:transposase